MLWTARTECGQGAGALTANTRTNTIPSQNTGTDLTNQTDKSRHAVNPVPDFTAEMVPSDTPTYGGEGEGDKGELGCVGAAPSPAAEQTRCLEAIRTSRSRHERSEIRKVRYCTYSGCCSPKPVSNGERCRHVSPSERGPGT